MKLELGYIQIKDIQFSKECKVDNGTLYVDRAYGPDSPHWAPPRRPGCSAWRMGYTPRRGRTCRYGTLYVDPEAVKAYLYEDDDVKAWVKD